MKNVNLLGVEKMKTLEDQVRESLIQKKADESYELTQQPKYQAMIKDMIKTMYGPMLETLGDTDSEEDDSAEIMSGINNVVEQLISDPEQLRQQAYQQAKIQYMTKEEIESQFSKMYGNLNENGDFGDEALQEFRRANENLYMFFDYKDDIVAGLVEIAEREGVEKALTDEAEYEVIRSIFPTKEEYIAFCENGLRAVKDYFAQVQKAMAMDGEVGQVIGAMYEGIQKAVYGMQEMREQAQKDSVLKKAQKIYGA